LLVRRELKEDFGTDCFGADLGDEVIGYANVDVAFEQGFADFGESGVEMLFGELALAAEVLECALGFSVRDSNMASNFYCRGRVRVGQRGEHIAFR
jgi:hypothetical protein